MKLEIGITNTSSVNYPLNELPLVCKYYQDNIFVSTERGSIIKKQNGSFQQIKLHSNLIHDFAFKNDLIYTCSQDQTVCIFDLNSSAKSFLKFGGAVKSIIVNDNQIIVGCKDKTVTILDTRSQNKKILQDNTTTLQFNENLYSMGPEGLVRLWDFRNYKPIELNVYANTRKYGFVHSCMKGNLYCLSMNNQIYEISLDLQVKKIHQHPDLQVGFFNKIDVSSCGNFLTVGSKSNDIIIFDNQVLKGHMNDVCCVSWSEYDYKLCSVGDDYQLREWEFKVKNNYRKSLYFPNDDYFKIPGKWNSLDPVPVKSAKEQLVDEKSLAKVASIARPDIERVANITRLDIERVANIARPVVAKAKDPLQKIEQNLMHTKIIRYKAAGNENRIALGCTKDHTIESNPDLENIPPKNQKQIGREVKLKTITPIKALKKKKQNSILKYFNKN
ncbi:hypothetical protein HDV06_006678 [Boothiomyces sp. JEL0866]|nr:hypothetical protein HDV06_006678 [Boothiomyces sp. JEL0866]